MFMRKDFTLRTILAYATIFSTTMTKISFFENFKIVLKDILKR